MADEPNLTKKQLKARQFHKSKHPKDVATESAPALKKRKTRRGKGGRASHYKKQNRFIVFVGSLPNDITESELQAHFKSSSPNHIRLRRDKNIAFLEFDVEKDSSSIQRRMDIALLQHGTLLKGKRINVQLTVGGGGNSQNRLLKLRQKNVKMEEERRGRLKNMISEARIKSNNVASVENSVKQLSASAVHPDRARLLKQ